MREIFDEMTYIFVREKVNFLEKYVLKPQDYSKEKLIELKEEVEQIIYRLDKYIEELDYEYHFTRYIPEIHGTHLDYIHMNGLSDYETIKYFVVDATKRVELIKYVLGEEIKEETKEWISIFTGQERYIIGKLDEDGFDYNDCAHKFINFITCAFEFAPLEITYSKTIDIDLVVEMLLRPNDKARVSKGILFYDEHCDDLLNNFLEKAKINRYYAIEFTDGDEDEDCELLNILYNDILKDMSAINFVIIKNIECAMYNAKLRTTFVKFLSDTYDMDDVVFLFVNEYPHEFDMFQSLSKIRFYIGDDGCSFRN